MEWYFPANVSELTPLLALEGVLPHGGGTFLLRGGDLLGRVNGLISLTKLPLSDVKVNGENLEIGVTATFSSAVEKMKKLASASGANHSCVLSKALSAAAATPIRNRATIGGSVAALPPWSDLIAPLSVIDAKVALIGKNAGEYKFIDFLSRAKELLTASLISHISIPIKELAKQNAYYRETRVAFDYPSFTVAINVLSLNGKIDDIRIAVSGTTERVNRLSALEKSLIGQHSSILKKQGLAKDVELKFGRKPSGSPEYLAHAARVAIERGLAELHKGDAE